MGNKSNQYFSIIVPVYNAEKTINRLIESISVQTYPYYELICIDDGSMDKSFKICHQYSLIDSRIKIYKKGNGGVSSARNYGLKKALYNNIIFIDSDDYVAPDYLERFYIEGHEFDLTVAGYISKDDNIETPHIPSLLSAQNPSELETNFAKFDNGNLGTVTWKMFKKNIIENNHIQFEDIESEDELFSFNYLQFIHSFKRIEYAGYYYVKTKNSRNSQHKNLAELNWINKMECNYDSIFNRFPSLKNNLSYIKSLQRRFITRYKLYALKGYYNDAAICKQQRIQRWDMIALSISKRKYKINVVKDTTELIFFIICKLRLYYLIDSLLLFKQSKK